MSAAPAPDLGALFDEHVASEFVARDVDATMGTMTDEPYVWHVPALTGAAGRDAVRRFYSTQFIGHNPPDATLHPIARTVSSDRVIDEFVLELTHDREIPWMLPGVAPTGRKVRVPTVVVMGFEDGKVAYEHIYWDQASVLAQVGLLDPSGLPVAGGERADRPLAPPRRREATFWGRVNETTSASPSSAAVSIAARPASVARPSPHRHGTIAHETESTRSSASEVHSRPARPRNSPERRSLIPQGPKPCSAQCNRSRRSRLGGSFSSTGGSGAGWSHSEISGSSRRVR